MYLLPMVYNWTPHENIYEGIEDSARGPGKRDLYKNRELELQISFSIPLVKKIGQRNWDVLVAYTHRSYWQVYNSAWSRPFRETNYTPEVFSRYVFSTPKSFRRLQLVSFDAGYAHQSNGQIQQLSRGWDRLFVRTEVDAWGVHAQLSAWVRLENSRDDNPHIEHYFGHGQVELSKAVESHTLHLKLPLLARYPSVDFKYSYPLSEGIRWLVSYQSGYGHSLIEYDRFTQRVGVGFLLEDLAH
jgi:phospholipase A1